MAVRSATPHMCRALRPAEMQRSTECATPASAPQAAWRSTLAPRCGALWALFPAASGSEAVKPANAPIRSSLQPAYGRGAASGRRTESFALDYLAPLPLRSHTFQISWEQGQADSSETQ